MHNHAHYSVTVMCINESNAYRQVATFKRIFSIEEKLNNRLEQLKQWLLKLGYKEGHVDSEIETVKLVKRTFSFQKQGKKVDDSITLILTYHLALKQLYQVLRRTHKQVLKSPRLLSALPSPPRVAFGNPRTIRGKLVRSNLKGFIYKDTGTNFCGHSNCYICKYMKVEISLKVRLPRKNTALIFHLFVTVVAKFIY